MTPALAEQGIIDYTSRQGYRIYGSATIKLDDIKYNGSADMLFPFLELMEERAKNYGWDNGIMMIPNQIWPPTYTCSVCEDSCTC